MAPPVDTAAGKSPRRTRLLLRLAALLIAATVLVPLVLIVLYRFVNPPVSALMLTQSLAGTSVSQRWVPLDAMSRDLIAAVVSNEDARFCKHWGIDWGAVRDAWRESRRTGRPLRGASTITMQTAKNLFLWQGRSYLRKALELPLAYVMTLLWSKPRTLEIYLNVAEWAPGVFGAEAAARHHFRTSAAKLTRRQATLLAAALPNPYVRRAGRPGPKTQALARVIETRMRKYASLMRCVLVKP